MINLRNALRRLSHELGLKGRYTHNDVIREVRAKHPELVAAHSQKLEDIALRRILSDVESRQSKTYGTGQGDLFPELAGFPGSYDAKSIGLADKRGMRIPLQSLSIKIVLSIVNYVKPVRKNSSLSDKLRTYLLELSPDINSDEDIFGDVIKRNRQRK